MNIKISVMSTDAARQIAILEGQLTKLRTQLASLRAAGAEARAGVDSATSAVSRNAVATKSAAEGLVAFGNKLQYTGRQLSTNFTLPILLAAGAATKFALDNEKAMVRVTKVYGDGVHGAAFYKNEINALQKAFVALSDEYGVAQKDVINIAADWAQAGASGVALAKATKLTLETMVLGELDAADATKALISIQAQYGFQVEDTTGKHMDLVKTIQILNMVENQTGIDMEGLIQGFQRSAGSARAAGVDVRHLAALLAALTPAAGTAAQAGNALKTIFSRLFVPTKDAANVLGLMGINVKSMAWETANGNQKIEVLAKTFEGLSSVQKNVVSSVLASRYQISRFDVLMQDVSNTNGYYQKSLQATSSQLQNYKQMQFELNQVLESDPQKIHRVWIILQNAMAQVIVPMIPLIVYLATSISDLMVKFSNLDPSIQKIVLAMLALVAVVGPITRVIASFAMLFGEIGKAILFLGKPLEWLGAAWESMGKGITRLGKYFLEFKGFVVDAITGAFGFLLKLPAMIAMVTTEFGAVLSNLPALIAGIFGAIGDGIVILFTSPIGLAIAAVIATLVVFHNQVAQLVKNVVTWWQGGASGIVQAFAPIGDFFNRLIEGIIKAFYAMPKGVQNAMMAVVQTVEAAAKAVYKLFSYFNPFAKHSPSLVDNVKTGMHAVKGHYSSAGDHASKLMGGLTGDLSDFNASTADARNAANQKDIATQRAEIVKYSPNAGGSFDKLQKDLTAVTKLFNQSTAAMNKQQAVVDTWKDKLDAANAVLTTQQKKLSDLKDVQQNYADKLSAAKDSLSNFASAPIVGMKAMADQTFANTEAQKQLQLQMMKWEDSNGTLDTLQGNLAKVQGQIEKMNGERDNLRQAGAGSDVLGGIDDQVRALQKQQGALTDTINNSPLADMQKQLDSLNRQGTELDLLNSITFDPLQKQIADLANTQKELSFDDIIKGIQDSQADVDKYTAAYDKATDAVNKQQTAVDAAQATVDKTQASYDKQAKALDVLKAKNQEYSDSIDKVNKALQTMVDLANSADSAAKAKKSPADSASVAAFKAGTGVNYPAVGGTGKIGREGGIADQSDEIDKFTKDVNKEMSDLFGKFDMLAPIKNMWKKATDWWKANVAPSLAPIGAALSDSANQIFGGIDWGSALKPFTDLTIGSGVFPTTIKKISDTFNMIPDAWRQASDLLLPPIKQAFHEIEHAVDDMWTKLKPAFAQFKDVIGPLDEALGHLWRGVIQPLMEFIVGTAIADLTIWAHVFADVIGPEITLFGDALRDLLNIVHDIVMAVLDLINGDWSKAWEQFVKLGDDATKALEDLVNNFTGVIIGVITGFATGFVALFQKLWDDISGSNGTVAKMVVDIVNWIAGLPDSIAIHLIKFADDLKNAAHDAWTSFMTESKDTWRSIKDWIEGLPVAAALALGNIGVKLHDLASSAFTGFLNAAKDVWGNVHDWLAALPQNVFDLLNGIIDKLNGIGHDAMHGFWEAAKTVWADIHDWFTGKDGVINRIVGFFTDLPARITTATSGMFDGIKTAFKDAINWVITKWNNLSFTIPGVDTHIPGVGTIGGFTLGTPNIPLLARGGFVTNGAQAIVGEGAPGYPEYVIPTDPAYRGRSISLLTRLVSDLRIKDGMVSTITGDTLKSISALSTGIPLPRMASGGTLGMTTSRPTNRTVTSTTGSDQTVININGNLSFPNITSAADSGKFIDNLKTLART
jgi:TP901 family phage tail tape measure protein